MTFYGRKYLKLFPAACTTLAAGMLMEIIDVSVSGWILGPDAAAAVTVLATPITMLEFESFLCGIGGTVLFLNYTGRFDERNAHRAFGTTFLFAILLGIATALFFLLMRAPYLRIINPGDSIGAHVLAYYLPFLFIAAVQPACYCLNSLVYVDGDAAASLRASIVQLVVNAVSSCMLCRWLGIAGCAIGTLAGFLAAVLMLSAHFFRPGKTFRVFCHFSPRMLPPIIKIGTIDGLTLLFWAFLLLGVEAVVVRMEGSEMLSSVTAIWVITGLVTVFDAPAIAAQPLIETYLEERNYRIARQVARLATCYSVALGGLMGLCFLIYPDAVLFVADLRNAPRIADARLTIRVFASTLVFWAFSFYLQRFYIFIRYARAAVFLCVLKDAVFPCILAAALLPMIGVHGLWIGWCLAIPLAIAVTLLMIAKTRGRLWVPFGLPPPLPKRTLQTHSLRLSPDEIRKISLRLSPVVSQFADPQTGDLSARIIESTLSAILHAAAGVPVYATVTLDFSQGFALVIAYDCKRPVFIDVLSDPTIPAPVLITSGAFPRLLYRLLPCPLSE